MKHETQEGQTPAFTGTSKKSLDDAIEQASLEAKKYFESTGREGKIYLQVLRQEVAIGNPHISEYRVFITESGPGG